MSYCAADLADEVYDKLFNNTDNQTIDFCNEFIDAEVSRDFAYIKLNDEFIIKIERV